jgi:hypothetical protein
MAEVNENMANLLINELWTKKLEGKNNAEKAALAKEIWDATLGNLENFKNYLENKNHDNLSKSPLVTRDVFLIVKKFMEKKMHEMLKKEEEEELKAEEAAEITAAKHEDERRTLAANKAAKKFHGETKEKPLVRAPVAKNQDNIQNVPKAIVYAPVYKLPMDKSKPKKKSMFDCFPFCRKDDALGGGRKHKKRKTRKHKKRKTRKHKKRKIKKTRKHKKKKTKRKTRRKR